MRARATVALIVAGCSSRRVRPTSGQDAAASPDCRITAASACRRSTPLPVTSVRIGPLTPRDADRITAEDRAAIELLGASAAGAPSDGGATNTGLSPRRRCSPATRRSSSTNGSRPSVRSSRFDSLDEIEALGYVRSSAPIAGIGSHWVRWRRLAEPFDPAQPSMLLFDESRQPARLVGFSYWLQSATEPEGFAGSNDHWHQHHGLCIVNGWADRERATGPDACADTFLAGGDLWMLHAWPVAGYENTDGKFATFNAKLCPPIAGTPDIARCPE